MNHEALPVQLDQQDWFLNIVSLWDDGQGQSDSAEFLHLMMRGVAGPCYNHAWEKRYLDTAQLRLVLQWDPDMLPQDSCPEPIDPSLARGKWYDLGSPGGC